MGAHKCMLYSIPKCNYRKKGFSVGVRVDYLGHNWSVYWKVLFRLINRYLCVTFHYLLERLYLRSLLQLFD